MKDSTSEGQSLVWPDDPEVIAEIESYRKNAESLFESIGFSTWSDNALTDEFRLGILDLQEGDERPVPAQPSSPRDLWLYLEKALSDAAPLQPSRHLILLEGFNSRLAEVLNVKLGIPPEFWLSHLEEKRKLHILDPSVMNTGSSIYWRVHVPQRHFIPADPSRPKGLYYAFSDGHFREHVSLDHDGEYKYIWHPVSFWGSTHREGAWMTLILMDTPSCTLTPIFTPSVSFTNRVISRLATEDAEKEVHQDAYSYHVMPKSPKNNSRRFHPLHNSIWDASVEAHKIGSINLSGEPHSATAIVRNIIFTAWEAYLIQETGLNVVWLADFSDRIKLERIHTEQDQQAFIERSKNTVFKYLDLGARRQVFLHNSYYISLIITQFRCDDAEYLASQQDADLWTMLAGEARRWRALRDRFQWMDEVIADIMAMYAQGAAMEEAFASKLQAFENYQQTVAANKHTEAATRMARSSGQLAKIATVAVPCTVAASILSMNGDFAAGERLFFVYWCVAIPTTLVLLVWVIQKDIVDLMRKMGGKQEAKAFSDNESSHTTHTHQSPSSH